jgi:hypothetical protein
MFTLAINCNGQDNLIQLIDDQGNKASFPESFVLQNKTIKNMMEDISDALTQGYMRSTIEEGLIESKTYELPRDIPIFEINELYINSLDDFKNISLRKLVDVFLYAEKLENTHLETKILKEIHKKLIHLPPDDQDVQYAREILSQRLGYIQEVVGSALLLKTTNILNKELVSSQFKDLLTDYTVQKFSKVQYNFENPTTNLPNVFFAVPITPPEHAGYFLLFEKPKGFFWKNRYVHLQHLRDRYALAYEYEQPGYLSNFDWNQVRYLAYNNASLHLKTLAFAIPGKIAISLISYGTNHESKLLNLNKIKSNALCTHITFSYDSKKLSCIVDKKPYIIDITTNKITPITIPADIFSSILITDSILLVRTIQGNTYSYNLNTKQLIYLPPLDIDYFTVGYKERDRVLVLGFRQATDSLGKLTIEEVSASIELYT